MKRSLSKRLLDVTVDGAVGVGVVVWILGYGVARAWKTLAC